MPLQGTRNHNFLFSSRWYRQGRTEIGVLPNDTDGPLQTNFGGHDGLILGPLKKRFIIAGDYGIALTRNFCIVPTQADMQAAVITPDFATPDWADKMRMCNAQLWQGGHASTTIV